jgi:L-fuculose-phosphate aldolase
MTRYHERQPIVEALIEAGRRLDTLGLVPARDGNLSARLGPDRFLVTATGVRKRALLPRDFVTVDDEGRPVGSGRPSSEIGLHLAVYRRRPDVGAVFHAHPPVAVGYACAGLGLTDCLVPEVAVNLGAVPLTPYATPGSPELEQAIAPILERHDAFLLANHGAVTLGRDVAEAADRMETLEHFARISLVARLLGGGKILSEEDIAPLEAIRRRMGNPRPVTCAPARASGTPAPRPAPRSAAPPLPSDLAEVVAEVVRSVLGSGGVTPR